MPHVFACRPQVLGVRTLLEVRARAKRAFTPVGICLEMLMGTAREMGASSQVVACIAAGFQSPLLPTHSQLLLEAIPPDHSPHH